MDSKIKETIIATLIFIIGFLSGFMFNDSKLTDHKLTAGHPILEERQESFEQEVRSDIREIKESLITLTNKIP